LRAASALLLRPVVNRCDGEVVSGLRGRQEL